MLKNTPKIKLRGLFKIFGADDKSVLPHVQNGMSKEKLLEKHKHVLGLQSIDVDMQAGEITVVMGLSGSGKSTLIRHLNRLIEPTSGEIVVDGEDVTQLSQADLRTLRQEKMSMVFQKFALLPHRTVQQNAAMSLDVRGMDKETQDTEARKWLERVGLGGYEDHYTITTFRRNAATCGHRPCADRKHWHHVDGRGIFCPRPLDPHRHARLVA